MFNSICNIFNNQVNNDTKNHVYVNVYDMLEPNYLTNIGYYALGVGIFHSGVEINGKEYCFGGHYISNVTGVFVIEPKIGIPELVLKQTYDMGRMNLSDNEFQELLVSISGKYLGPSYNLITRNCNHFTEEFVKRLVNKSIPSWVNRAARLGDMFPCIVPWDWIQPPQPTEEPNVSLSSNLCNESSPLLQNGFSSHQKFQGINL